MLNQLEKDKVDLSHSIAPSAQNLRKELQVAEGKLERLLSAYLNGALELAEYQSRKKELLERKAGLKERLANFGREEQVWLELYFGRPARAFYHLKTLQSFLLKPAI